MSLTRKLRTKKKIEQPPLIAANSSFLIVKLEDTRILATQMKNVKILVEFCKKFNCTMLEAQSDNDLLVYTIEEFVDIAASTATPRDFQNFKTVKTILEPKSTFNWTPIVSVTNIKKSTSQDIKDFIKQEIHNTSSSSQDVIVKESTIFSKFPDRKPSKIIPIIETCLNRLNDYPLNPYTYVYTSGIGVHKVKKIKKIDENKSFYGRYSKQKEIPLYKEKKVPDNIWEYNDFHDDDLY